MNPSGAKKAAGAFWIVADAREKKGVGFVEFGLVVERFADQCFDSGIVRDQAIGLSSGIQGLAK